LTFWLILILVASALAPLFWFRDFFSRLSFSENPERLLRELRTLIPAGTPLKKALALLTRNGFETGIDSDEAIRGQRVWRKTDGPSWKIEATLLTREGKVVECRVGIHPDHG